jgi:hypothetical protein
VLLTERDTPGSARDGSRTFHAFAHDAGVAAHPHLPRHSLASAMRRQGTRQRDRRAADLAVKALLVAG